MESLGDILRAAREKRGWSYDYVSNETNISSRYLEALEKEDFSPFPSEPYVIGFLRSYSEYLDLNSDEILSMYRLLKLQEQPPPMEQLLKGPSRKPKIIRTLAAGIALTALAVVLVLFIINLPKKKYDTNIAARAAAEYVLNTDFLERRFYPGDSILVSDGTDSYRLVFTSLSDAVIISTPSGPVMLDLGQELTIDINKERFNSLRITAADFVKNDQLSGALLRFELETPPQTAVTQAIPIETFNSEREAVTVIYASQNAQPITLQAAFNSYCFFRYEILYERDRPGRSEQFYQRSEEISITALNGIRLGISNAQAVRLQAIIGGRFFPFDTGGAGEVVAADLRWVRDEENNYRLVLIRLE